MKDRFTLENLPLSFLDEFHCIETDELKQAVVDVANLMYDDYSVEEVQEMFSTFSSTMYEVYSLFLYNRDAKNLDLIVEALLYCASQFESYKVRQFRKSNQYKVHQFRKSNQYKVRQFHQSNHKRVKALRR